jgi:CRISPR system Cascade subunit CasC
MNRDETGRPKTTEYGGVLRSRVSSQSWKHEIRKEFQKRFDTAKLGYRTMKVVTKVAEKIELLFGTTHEVAMERAELALKEAGFLIKYDKKKEERIAGALFFITDKQAENLAQLAMEDTPLKKQKLQEALNHGYGIDIAMFGRMLAGVQELGVGASVQVAHAISTHRVEIEYDFFTAIDDLKPDDKSGAAMIETTEYTSSTLYRYATISVHELFQQLESDVETTAYAVTEFVRAFITTMPRGMQNRFGNRKPADAVLINLRNDQPVNMAGAFEEAVRLNAGDSGYVKPSIQKLADYVKDTLTAFVSEPVLQWSIGSDFAGLVEPMNLPAVLAAIGEQVQSVCGSNISEPGLNNGE